MIVSLAVNACDMVSCCWQRLTDQPSVAWVCFIRPEYVVYVASALAEHDAGTSVLVVSDAVLRSLWGSVICLRRRIIFQSFVVQRGTHGQAWHVQSGRSDTREWGRCFSPPLSRLEHG